MTPQATQSTKARAPAGKRPPKTPPKAQGASICRTISLGSKRLTGAARHLFPGDADYKFQLVASVAADVLGRGAVANKMSSLQELIELQCTEVQTQLEKLAEVQKRARSGSQGLNIQARRNDLQLTLGTRAGFRTADLVELIDQVLVGVDGLWIAGVLPDAKRDEVTDGLLKRLNQIQRSVDLIGKEVREEMAQINAPQKLGVDSPATQSAQQVPAKQAKKAKKTSQAPQPAPIEPSAAAVEAAPA